MKKMAVLVFLLLLVIYAVRVASRTPERLRRSVFCACWLYGIASVGLWLILRVTGEQWWPATVFLFGPRWVWLLPLIPLIVAAVWVRRRALWILLPTVWVVLFPVMGFNVPWRLVTLHFQGAPCVRVLTCNIHRQSTAALSDVVSVVKPDVVVIQEWSAQPPAFRPDRGQWYFCTNGELFLASRYPIRKVVDLSVQTLPDPGMAVCYELEMPGGNIHFINLRFASPHSQLEDLRWHSPSAYAEVQSNSVLRAAQFRIISHYALDLGPATILAGDFNTPDGSILFREYCSAFCNGFSVAGWGFGHTYFAPWEATRIDNILAGPVWRCRRCWVGPDVGSPHRPLIADWEFIGQGNVSGAGIDTNGGTRDNIP